MAFCAVRGLSGVGSSDRSEWVSALFTAESFNTLCELALTKGVLKLLFLCCDGGVLCLSAGFDKLLAKFDSFLSGSFFQFLIIRHRSLALNKDRGERDPERSHFVGEFHETPYFRDTAGNAIP